MIGCTSNSSRSAVCAYCNLVLIPVPEIISLQPVEVPDHGHYDQDPDHQLNISSEITLYIFLPLSHFMHWWLGTCESISMSYSPPLGFFRNFDGSLLL